MEMKTQSSDLESLIEITNDETYPVRVRPEQFYPNESGFQNFYGTRKTDGGRAAIYLALMREHVQGIDVLNGLGCGDSAIEATLINALGHDETTYNAVDSSLSMLRHSEHLLADSCKRVNSIHGSFHSNDVIEQVRKHCENAPKRSNIITTILGRTFGNHDLADWAGSTFSLLDFGGMLIDFYTANSEGEENAFRSRMQEIAEESSSFFTHPLLLAGFGKDEVPVKVDISEFNEGLVANFYTINVNDINKILLHQIRSFNMQGLKSSLNKFNAFVDKEFYVSGQLAPMGLIYINRKR